MTDPTLHQRNDADSAPELPEAGTFDYLVFIRERFYFWLNRHWAALVELPFGKWRARLSGQMDYLDRARFQLMEEFEQAGPETTWKPTGRDFSREYEFSVYPSQPGKVAFGWEIETEFQAALWDHWNAAAASGDTVMCRLAREDLLWVEATIKEGATTDLLEYDEDYTPPKTGLDRALEAFSARCDEAEDYLRKKIEHEERENRPATEHDVTTSEGKCASSHLVTFPFCCAQDGVHYSVQFKKTKHNFLFRIDRDWTISKCRLGEASGSTTILIPDVRLDWSKFSCPRCRETACGGFCCGCYWCGTTCRKCKGTLSAQPKIHRVTGENG